MKLDFRKNVRRNMLANAGNSATRLLFPFLNRTLFLWLLGPAYLGLNGLFGSVLGVLMLAELGFGQAVVCSMYKPVADDDRELLCAYLKFYRAVYRCVGAAIFALGLCLLPFLGRLVHGDVPPDVNLHVLFLIHLVNTAASYFLFAYRGVVLGAHHRNDVVTNIRTAVMVAQYAVSFLVLYLARDYTLYVVVTVFFTLLQNVLLVKASRRLFPDVEPRGVLPPEKRRQVVSDVQSIFMHKVGGVVAYQSDNIVVSAFLGLVAVAAYGNYFYVASAVASLVAIVSASTTGGFGNRIHTDGEEANFSLLLRVNRLSMAVVSGCAAMMAALVQPFMEVWTKGDPALVRHALTPALMTLCFYLQQMRSTLLSFKTGAGLWRPDRFKPLVAGGVNLALSVALVLALPDAWKLDGVIVGTIAAYLVVEVPWEVKVVFDAHFGPARRAVYIRQMAGFAGFALALCAAACAAAALVPGAGVAGLLAKGAAAAAATGTGLGLLFRHDFRRALRRRFPNRRR